ncbi:hypothetical protein CRE_27734 [Caenorhabditis remanei]|uniref:Uncharacterized protein n=2 Tax=Caenorhabditis remanei TaxID=31234 RepID=E3MXN4_CAERE|nr:hypothetical protein CRE_27734 [Caenorhabditis remanei]
MEKLDSSYFTGHHLAETVKLPFNGGCLPDHYKKAFGVDIHHRMSPIVMNLRLPHAMEFIWFRHEMECGDTTIDEEEETEVKFSEMETAESDNDNH